MRICHVWERFWPIEIGGLERYILWLSSYLAKSQNIEFSLITGRTKLTLLTKNIKKYEDAGFLKVYRLGPSPIDLINSFFMYAGDTDKAPTAIEKLRFVSRCNDASKWDVAATSDAFHIHGVWRDMEWINLGVYLSRLYHKPLVLTLHGGFVGNPSEGGMPLETPVVLSLLKNDVSAITTYSKEVYRTLEKLGLAEKSHFITNFVDTNQFINHEPVPPHDPTIIYVGRLEPVQTPDLVLEAFKIVHDQYPKSKFILVGYGKMFETLKARVKELNLEDSVSMVGKQSDVRKFLWNSDIFVSTNFGYIATLEAWAAGLAVVAPEFGVLKETVSHQNNGLIFEPANVNSLADALLKLVKDKTLRQQLAQNGTRAVQDYDIRSVAPKMAKVYRSVIKE